VPALDARPGLGDSTTPPPSVAARRTDVAGPLATPLSAAFQAPSPGGTGGPASPRAVETRRRRAGLRVRLSRPARGEHDRGRHNEHRPGKLGCRPGCSPGTGPRRDGCQRAVAGPGCRIPRRRGPPRDSEKDADGLISQLQADPGIPVSACSLALGQPRMGTGPRKTSAGRGRRERPSGKGRRESAPN
jgi:hypothetical protein